MIIHKLGFVFPQLGALNWPQMSPRCVDCMWGPRCCAFCRHWWSMDVMDWTMRVGYIKHLQIKQATKSNNSNNNNNNNKKKKTDFSTKQLIAPVGHEYTSQCFNCFNFPEFPYRTPLGSRCWHHPWYPPGASPMGTISASPKKPLNKPLCFFLNKKHGD